MHPGPRAAMPSRRGSRPADDHAKHALSVTSHDVADAAGVSQSTVSRALRGDPRVPEATRSRVLAVAAQLGYTPSEVGRSLVTRSTRTVGIVVTDLTSIFYPYVVAPLHDEFALRGYRMVVFTEGVESGEPPSEAAVERLLDRSIDGAVLTTSRLDGAVPRQLWQRGLPFVFLTRVVEGIAADSAAVDNALGASLAAAEVVRLGHRRVAAIFGPGDTSTGRDRERGTRSALDAAGIALPAELVRRGPFLFDTGYRGMEELMALNVPPTVVICSNDTVAIGAFNAARAAGKEIPRDVSLVGFDNLPMAAWEVFQLTTVHQPIEDMARTAARLLIERIEGGATAGEARHVVFEPRLVLRRTLAPLPEPRP
jgi:LacI family transcriptional regulator